MLNNLIKELQNASNPKQAKILQRFFKTGEGEYGEGDVFLGIKVPVQRSIAKKYYGLGLVKIKDLLKSKIHERRLTGLLILDWKYKKASDDEKENIFNFYLQNIKSVNNWDLVDLSVPNIIGDFLSDKKKNILYELVRSENLWDKRIAIVSTFAFIKKHEFEDALAISELLLKDNHDLIHKAVGWMLREVGKKDLEVLEGYLMMNYKKMPRTMLRYAIEKFDEETRKRYLRGEV
jgi:3-methyladenine DNA glycosylase AlkD